MQELEQINQILREERRKKKKEEEERNGRMKDPAGLISLLDKERNRPKTKPSRMFRLGN